MVMEKKKTIVLYCLLALALVGILCSVIFGAYNLKAIQTLQDAAGVSPDGSTQEDDVAIMNGEYRIVSTKPISDAYKSGNTSGLDNKQKETLEMATAVLDEIITEDMSDYDKEKAVYDWMTTELTYDTGILQVIPATEEDCDNPYGVLKYHNAVCVGYATTFRLFMQMMDIECMVVHNPEKYHSWDLVNLDGNWYHVDIYSDQGSASYANFNMNDDLAERGHEWDRDFFPSATSLDYNYAYQNRKQVDDIYDVPALVREALDNEQSTVCLGFEVIDEPHAQIVDAMLNSVQDIVTSGEFGDLWMDWGWMHIADGEYILSIYLYGFEQDETNYELSDEDLEKVDEAVRDAFDGMSGDPEDNDDEDYDDLLVEDAPVMR